MLGAAWGSQGKQAKPDRYSSGPCCCPQLLTQLRSAQEEENRQLLAEVQALSRENRELLERSLESRDHLHREQREYL